MTDAAFYSRATATAVRLLQKFGAAGSLTRPDAGNGAYNPETGETTPTAQTFGCMAAVLDYDAKAIDGTLIRAGDARVLVAPSKEFTPQEGDVFAVAGRSLTAIRVSTLAPAGFTVLHEVQARGL